MTRRVAAQEASSGEDDDMPLAQLIGLRAAARPAAPRANTPTRSGAAGPALRLPNAETPPAPLFSSSPACGGTGGATSQQPDGERPPADFCTSSPACGGTEEPALQQPAVGQPLVPPAGNPACGRNRPALEQAAARRGAPAASPGVLGCRAPQAPRSKGAAAPAARGESVEPAELLIPDSQEAAEASGA
jgi:hypothetical protein